MVSVRRVGPRYEWEAASVWSYASTSVRITAVGSPPILVSKRHPISRGATSHEGADRSCSTSEQVEQDRLERMEPVLGLVEHGGTGMVYDVIGDLQPPMGGKAVHEDRLGAGTLE